MHSQWLIQIDTVAAQAKAAILEIISEHLGYVVGAAIFAVLSIFIRSIAKILSGIGPFLRLSEYIVDLWYLVIGRSSSERFTILIATLDGDDARRTHTNAIAHAFRGRKGIERIRANRILRIAGVGADAEARALSLGRKWLTRRSADLLIWGEVIEQGKALQLWFLGRDFESEFQNSPFRLQSNRLQDDFHEAATAQLVAVALSAVKPATERVGIYLTDALRPVASGIEHLLADPSRFTDRQRAELLDARGVALSVLASRSGDRTMHDEAIENVRTALSLLNRSEAPRTWAAMQHHLGTALSRAGEFENTSQKLRSALSAFRLALEERARKNTPMDWAWTHTNIGWALTKLGTREANIDILKEAQREFEFAAWERTRDRSPLLWASTQMGLGVSILNKGAITSDTAELRKAEEIFRTALAEVTTKNDPGLRVGIHINLGITLQQLFERTSELSHIEDAISQYRSASDECEPGSSPVTWATIQLDLAYSLMSLGLQKGDRSDLLDALQIVDAALDRIGRDQAVRLWAGLHACRGKVLFDLSEVESGTKPVPQLLRAIPAEERATLGVGGSIDWNAVHQDLHAAVTSLVTQDNSVAQLNDAVASFQLALSVFTLESDASLWATANNNMGVTLLKIGVRDHNNALLRQAASAFRDAQRAWTRQTQPIKWATAQYNIGSVLLALGGEHPTLADLENAQEATQASLDERMLSGAPIDQAACADLLGYILYRRAELDPGITYAEQAVENLRWAVATLRRFEASRDAAIASEHLQLAEVLLQSRKEERDA